MSNLRLINETTISSAVSVVDITDVFSADFDIYKITGSALSTAGSTTYCQARLINSAGSVTTDSSYDDAYLSCKTNASFGEAKNVNIAFWQEFLGDADGGAEGTSGVAWLYNPFSSSSYTFHSRQTFHSQAGIHRMYKGIGAYKQATSCTGIRIDATSLSQDLTGGVIRTYGLRVDS